MSLDLIMLAILAPVSVLAILIDAKSAGKALEWREGDIL
jgi:hypothetical protein